MVEAGKWNRVPNKGTSHHSGLVMWAEKSLGLLKRVKSPVPSAVPLLSSRTLFVNKPLSRALRQRLQKVRDFGSTLMAVPKRLETLDDYTREQKRLCKWGSKVPGLSGPKSYGTRWVIRSYLDWVIRRQKNRVALAGLKTSSRNTVGELRKAFPDQSQWLATLGRNDDSTMIAGVCRELGYKGPIEHLTMHLCLCLSKTGVLRSLQSSELNGGLQDMARAKRNLIACRKRLTSLSALRFEIPPHPAVAVQT